MTSGSGDQHSIQLSYGRGQLQSRDWGNLRQGDLAGLEARALSTISVGPQSNQNQDGMVKRCRKDVYEWTEMKGELT